MALLSRYKVDKPKGCLLCGYEIHITRHHIIPKSEGGKLNPLNKLWCCPNCHWECQVGRYSKDFQREVTERWLRLLGYDVEELRKEFEGEPGENNSRAGDE